MRGFDSNTNSNFNSGSNADVMVMRKSWIVGGILAVVMGGLVPPVISQVTQNISEKESCCCCGGKKAAGSHPVFSTACYTGNGADGRVIPTGIAAAKQGFTMICEKTADAGNNNICIYWIPELGQTVSCAMQNSDIDPSGSYHNCFTDQLEGGYDNAIKVNAGFNDTINATGRPFCYWQWALDSAAHGTMQYTGDGSSPRVIPLPHAADVVMVGPQATVSAGGNVIFAREKDMPAGESYAVSTNTFIGTANYITTLTSSPPSFTVGANRNANGVVYNVAWWSEGKGTIDAFTYTGNGTSGPSGLCGLAGDTQVVSSSCTPVNNVWIMAADSSVGRSACGFQDLVCRAARSVAVGQNVTGPGNLTSTDFYGFHTIQPNNTNAEEVGALGNTFTVTGAPNFRVSCNDHLTPYYAFTTCGTLSSAGSISMPDWSGFMQVAIKMDLEDAPSHNFLPTNNYCTVSPPNGGTGACNDLPITCSCNMAENGTVDFDTTNKTLGAGSASFNASGDSFSVALSGLANTVVNLAGSVSFGVRSRPTTAIVNDDILTIGTTTQSYAIANTVTGSRSVCRGINGAGTATNAVSSFGASLDTWHKTICLFDDTANTIQNITDTTVNVAQALTSLRSAAGDFRIGGSNWKGQLQEFWVYNGVLTTADWCRICACGVDGSLCSCFSDDPTIYVSQGELTSCPTTCLTNMPVCNKAQPS